MKSKKLVTVVLVLLVVLALSLTVMAQPSFSTPFGIQATCLTAG